MNGSDPTTVFITGASSGIGLATVERLDARGYRIYAGVRRDDDAERLAQRGSAGLIPVCLDLTNPASIERALTRIEEDLGGKGLDAVVNNAGTTAVAPLEFTMPRDLYAESGGHLDSIVPVAEVIESYARAARIEPWREANPWPYGRPQ